MAELWSLDADMSPTQSSMQAPGSGTPDASSLAQRRRVRPLSVTPINPSAHELSPPNTGQPEPPAPAPLSLNNTSPAPARTQPQQTQFPALDYFKAPPSTSKGTRPPAVPVYEPLMARRRSLAPPVMFALAAQQQQLPPPPQNPAYMAPPPNSPMSMLSLAGEVEPAGPAGKKKAPPAAPSGRVMLMAPATPSMLRLDQVGPVTPRSWGRLYAAGASVFDQARAQQWHTPDINPMSPSTGAMPPPLGALDDEVFAAAMQSGSMSPPSLGPASPTTTPGGHARRGSFLPAFTCTSPGMAPHEPGLTSPSSSGSAGGIFGMLSLSTLSPSIGAASNERLPPPPAPTMAAAAAAAAAAQPGGDKALARRSSYRDMSTAAYPILMREHHHMARRMSASQFQFRFPLQRPMTGGPVPHAHADTQPKMQSQLGEVVEKIKDMALDDKSSDFGSPASDAVPSPDGPRGKLVVEDADLSPAPLNKTPPPLAQELSLDDLSAPAEPPKQHPEPVAEPVPKPQHEEHPLPAPTKAEPQPQPQPPAQQAPVKAESKPQVPSSGAAQESPKSRTPPLSEMHAQTLADSSKVPSHPLRSTPVTPRTAITINDFRVIQPLSRRENEGVYLAKKASSPSEVFAIKVLHKDSLERKNVNNLCAQFDIIDNPFVVKMYHSFVNGDFMYCVLDYVSEGDLLALLHRAGTFPEDTARDYFAEIVLAVEYLHGIGTVHRDLKPENILVGSNGHVKLTDFGVAEWAYPPETMKAIREGKPTEGLEMPNCLSRVEYAAPELILGRDHGEEVDWWALGCILFEFIVGSPPFHAETPQKTIDNVLNRRLTWSDLMSAEARDLIDGLLQLSPQTRLGAGGGLEVKTHQFFANINFELLRQDLDRWVVPDTNAILSDSDDDEGGSPQTTGGANDAVVVVDMEDDPDAGEPSHCSEECLGANA
eukprot:m51a1_g12378 putative protein kinase family protein (936) ;mRNA; f:615436-618653